MKTYIFPGQGSQARGMGGTLFDEFPELTEKADKILGYSIKELCLTDPRKELGKTQFTQPALYVVNALSYYKKLRDTGVKPDFVAGHSLGEINALLAAECFEFEVGLKLVRQRGELMSQVSNGAMAAVLNATKEEIESILQANGLHNIDLANYNSSSQIVISGLIDEIGKAQQFFHSGKMLYYPLNTSGAFHSRFMRGARDKFRSYLKRFKFSDPKIPVIANVTAQPYEPGAIVQTLAEQIASTVRWSESIEYLLDVASQAQEQMQFEEVGHGDVLTKIVSTIRQQFSAKRSQPAVDHAAAAAPAAPQAHAGTAAIASPAAVERSTRDQASSGKQSAADKVATWNQKYSVGTRIRSLTLDYGDLETRTPACVLFGHRAAIYVKGYNGYFDLDEVAPL